MEQKKGKYIVQWNMEVEADSMQEAAMVAKEEQLKVNTEHSKFFVMRVMYEGIPQIATPYMVDIGKGIEESG